MIEVGIMKDDEGNVYLLPHGAREEFTNFLKMLAESEDTFEDCYRADHLFKPYLVESKLTNIKLQVEDDFFEEQ